MVDKKIPLPPSVLHPYMGGHTVIYYGYLYELCPAHPFANRWGFVRQHRLVLERHLGYYLDKDLVVHHIDGDKLNNNLSNLVALTKSEHMKQHREEKCRKHFPEITYETLEQALQKFGGIKPAARYFGCDPQTLRNYYPDLTKLYQRKSPVKIDDEDVIRTVLVCEKLLK